MFHAIGLSLPSNVKSFLTQHQCCLNNLSTQYQGKKDSEVVLAFMHQENYFII